MWTKKYAIAVVVVTVLTLVVGALLWSSEKEQILDPFEAWSRGIKDAPITLHAFSDFT